MKNLLITAAAAAALAIGAAHAAEESAPTTDKGRKPAKEIRKPKAKPEAVPATRESPRVYSTGPRVLRDKDGNVIPTNPDAYNVDSALPPTPRKKS